MRLIGKKRRKKRKKKMKTRKMGGKRKAMVELPMRLVPYGMELDWYGMVRYDTS